MFGYIMINKPELKIKDYDMYRSYYCGVCRALKKRHGFLGRAMLNFDMTFLAMLLSDLYDKEAEVSQCRCIMHPVHKHCERYNAISDYCADMTVLLSYYKCMDDWNDEKKLNRKLLAMMLKGKCKKIEKMYPEKARFVEEHLAQLSELERQKDKPVDEVAKLFGEILAAVFVYKDDFWKDDLQRIGFYLGKYIYLLDAYEDIEKDKKSGDYNPFSEICEDEDFEEKVLQLMMLMIGECTDAFEQLPLVDNVEILRNILYSGVWVKYGQIKADRLKKQSEGSGECSDCSKCSGCSSKKLTDDEDGMEQNL